jgi:hypothetical protein
MLIRISQELYQLLVGYSLLESHIIDKAVILWQN